MLSVGMLDLPRAVATYAWLFENRSSVISWWCGAHPGIGTLFPLPTVALRTGEASYLAPSARTETFRKLLYYIGHGLVN